MTFRIVSLFLSLSATICSVTEAKVDRSILTKLNEPISSLQLAPHKAQIVNGLNNIWKNSVPTLREVILVPKTAFFDLRSETHERFLLKSPYQRWVLHLQRALAGMSLSLAMTNEDIEQFIQYPERIVFRSLRDLQPLVEFNEQLLHELEQLGVFTVYDLFKEFPERINFIEFVDRLASPGPIPTYGSSTSAGSGYTSLRKRDNKEQKALSELKEKYEGMMTGPLRAALGKMGIDNVDQLLNVSFADLARVMLEERMDTALVSELLFLLGRLQIHHPRMECPKIFMS